MTNDLNNTPEKTAEELAMAAIVAERVTMMRKTENEQKFHATLNAVASKDETVKQLIELGTIKDIIEANPSLTQMADSAAGIDSVLAIAKERFRAEEFQKKLNQKSTTTTQTVVDAPINPAGGGSINSVSVKDSDTVDFRTPESRRELEKLNVSKDQIMLANALFS